MKRQEEERPRSPSAYLWAMLPARIYESQAHGWALLGAPRMQVFPLLCPRCAEPMTIIALVTEAGSIKRILEYLGQPTTPPPITAARGPRRR